jgi:hypothetical protein
MGKLGEPLDTVKVFPKFAKLHKVFCMAGGWQQTHCQQTAGSNYQTPKK